jgi:hypothetical protein
MADPAVRQAVELKARKAAPHETGLTLMRTDPHR